ncbi:hypothetical protein PanWU01x14_212950 [Parasponia andersonii]|uniref:DUF4283 domain-containing protein n=1 Tax=Parasponia andersonii TaxID=3476 RepID=A0A2P5BSV3_PARAD|nr:hypothetical protein PanWU01x14_212950 [Parasponia andersonii]
MDLDEVGKLCERLNLDDGDGPVVRLDKGVYSERKETMDLCLVGKILGNKAANRDGLKGALQSTWRIPRTFHVEQIGSNNIFTFHFSNQEDRQRGFAWSPRSFEKQWMSLVIPTGIGEIAQMDFHKLPLRPGMRGFMVEIGKEECTRKQFEPQESSSVEKMKYGPWLKASEEREKNNSGMRRNGRNGSHHPGVKWTLVLISEILEQRTSPALILGNGENGKKRRDW